MTTPVRSNIFPLACAALLSLLACNPGQSASPTPSSEPTATASPSPAASCSGCPAGEGRWGLVIAFPDASGACSMKALAGPPRIGACRGETITWRVYNKCKTEQTVRLAKFVRLEGDPGVPTPDQEAYREREMAAAKDGDVNGPFVDGTVSVTVKAGVAADLELKVKADAKPGVYTYVTKLGKNPDADQQIEIWP